MAGPFVVCASKVPLAEGEEAVAKMDGCPNAAQRQNAEPRMMVVAPRPHPRTLFDMRVDHDEELEGEDETSEPVDLVAAAQEARLRRHIEGLRSDATDLERARLAEENSAREAIAAFGSLDPDLPSEEVQAATEPVNGARRRGARALTISMKRMTRRELEAGRALTPEDDRKGPRSRPECRDGPRPCPYVSCKHHLYLDVMPHTGAIKMNFPDLEVWQLDETCVLDVADRGGTILEEVGALMNLTRERARQLEVTAIEKLRATPEAQVLVEFIEGNQRRHHLRVVSSRHDEDLRAKDLDPSSG